MNQSALYSTTCLMKTTMVWWTIPSWHTFITLSHARDNSSRNVQRERRLLLRLNFVAASPPLVRNYMKLFNTLGGNLVSNRLFLFCLEVNFLFWPLSFIGAGYLTLTPNIKEQILLSSPHSFPIKVLGRSY